MFITINYKTTYTPRDSWGTQLGESWEVSEELRLLVEYHYPTKQWVAKYDSGNATEGWYILKTSHTLCELAIKLGFA